MLERSGRISCISILYMKRYGSADGLDLRMRIKREANVAIVDSIKMVEGRSNVRTMGR